MRRLSAIFWGCLIASLGVYVAGVSMSMYLCLMGIACFSIGEMLCSPKMAEFLGEIAPPDQEALYMGYANIPLAIGLGFGSFIGG
jgi:proton-dependent oligopeptide transporter, POT family